MVQLLIDGLARLHVGAYGDERHGVALEGVVIEHVYLPGHHVVAKLGVEVVARGQQRPQAAEAAVAGKPLVITDGAPRLPRLVVATEGGAGGDAYEAVGLYAVLHHHVGDAGGEQSAHGAALEYQSSLPGHSFNSSISF